MARKHKRRTRKRNKKGGFAGILDQKCQQKLAKESKDGKILVLM